MARIREYIKDDIVEPTDIVIGTEQSTGKTKNYSIDSIRNFFVAKTNVDNIIFKMGNHLVSGEFTANSNYFSGLTEFKFNMIDSKGDSITPIFSALKISLPTNGFVIKVEDSAKQNKFILAKILNIIDGGTFFTITLDAIKNVGAGELVIGNNFSLEVGLYTDTTSGVEWSNLLNKPTTFTPSAHTHIISDTIGLQAALDERFVSAEEKAAITHINRPALDLVSGINTGDQDLSGYELLSNKVISLSGASTNVQYPSAKLTFDQLALKEGVFSKNTAFNKNYSTLATDIKVNGVQSLGVLDTLPRADHIHPIDTSREPANANIQSHISSTLNPHAVTKTQVGLGNVDNTTDLLKPISTATQDALNLKENVANKQNSLATDGTGTKYPTVDAIRASNIPAESLNGSTFKTVQHIQDLFHSAGWTSGGVITNAGGGVITVSSGTGLIRATNSDIATIFFTDFAASIPANVVLVDGSQNYIYVEYNAGAPRIIATTIERADYNTNFLIGAVYRVGTTLHINSTVKTAISDHAGKMIAFNKEVMPYARANGSMISEVATRGFAITAGTFWNGLVRFTTNAFSTATSSFFYFYRNGVGGWTKVPTQTQINNTQFDNGTGALATLSNNKYGIHWVFIDTDGDTYVVYGQGDYTLIEAQNAMLPSSLPVEITSHGFVIGKIIIQKSTTSFTQIESAFAMGFAVATASEHNSLVGLQGGASGEYYHLTSAQTTIATQEATNTLSGYVSAGTQTFGGVKTFTLSPIVPTPTTNTQVANKTYVDGKVADTITDGVTEIAPSQNAVFDALALKEDKVNKNAINGYAGLDGSGKINPLQLPDLAITKVFTATETTIALFAVASGNYTFEEGDVVIIINGADTKHYIFKGGAKTTVGNYSLLNSSQIDWSQLVSVPTTLSGYGITGTKAQFDTAVTDGNFMYIGDAPTAHTHLLSGITDVTMTVANLNSLDDGVNSTLHFHNTDRDRANHTGAQLSSTISDFTEATQDAIGGALLDSTTIDLIYDDVNNTFSAQREALTGAITAPKNSNATTLTDDIVTNAKLANMAVNTIKGRITAGAGDPEDLTATQVRTIINVADGANNYIHPASHTISEVTGLQTALDGKVDDSQVLTNVPAGAVFTDTVYVHPTTDGNLHVPATGTTNNGKVLKAGATAGSLVWADDNDTIYTHPLNHPPSIITQDASNRFVTDAEKTIWNAKQPQLNGTGFVKASGTTISYDNSSYLPLGGKAADSELLDGIDSTGFYQFKSTALIAGTNADNLTRGFYFSQGLAVTNLPSTYGSVMVFNEGSYYGWQLFTNSAGELSTRAKSDIWGSWKTIWDNNNLTNPITGTGTTNYIPKFTGAGSLGNSQIFDNGTNVGIGLTSTTARLGIQGTTAMDLPTYGAEFLISTGWTSTEWTGDFATGWTHTTGNTSILSQATLAVNATRYQIAYTVTNRTAGSFTVSFGGQSLSGISATGAFAPTTTSTANLTITPTTDFNGTIVISIKVITAISTPIASYLSSDGISRIEIRVSSASNNTFIGIGAGRYNTTGTSNSFFGASAGIDNTTGTSNSFFGASAGIDNTTGTSNSFFGVNAGIGNTTGFNNSFFGVNAGRYIADGVTSNITASDSVFIGEGTKALADAQTNQIVIGQNAIGNGSNTATLGNNSITKTILKGNVLIGTTTDNGAKFQVNGSATFASTVTAGNIITPDIEINASSSIKYGARIIGASGGARQIFIAGQSGYSNGFTIDYNGTEMVYQMKNGNLTVGGTVTATDFIGSSDITLKENIQVLQPKKVNSNYKTFNFIGSEQQRVGVLAQELEIEHPEFVRTDDKGFKSVSYTDLHSCEIAYLKDKIDKLEELVNKLIG